MSNAGCLAIKLHCEAEHIGVGSIGPTMNLTFEWRRMALVAFAVGALLDCGTPPVTQASTSKSIPTKLSIPKQTATVLHSYVATQPMIINDSARQPAELSPCVYATAPYSMLIVVPQSIDPLMVCETDIGRFNMPCIEPTLRFEKR